MLWLCGYIGKLYATVKPKVISYVKYAPVKGTSLATGITLIKTMIGKNKKNVNIKKVSLDIVKLIVMRNHSI